MLSHGSCGQLFEPYFEVNSQFEWRLSVALFNSKRIGIKMCGNTERKKERTA